MVAHVQPGSSDAVWLSISAALLWGVWGVRLAPPTFHTRRRHDVRAVIPSAPHMRRGGAGHIECIAPAAP